MNQGWNVFGPFKNMTVGSSTNDLQLPDSVHPLIWELGNDSKFVPTTSLEKLKAYWIYSFEEGVTLHFIE